MNKIKVQRTDTLRNAVKYCVEDTELPSKLIQFLGALLVVDEDDWTLHQVYPLLGNTVYVGTAPTWEKAQEDWNKVDSYVTDVDKSMMGAYLQVDEDGMLLEIIPPPRRIVLDINWVPGFRPKMIESQIIGTTFGHDLADFTPFMDMIQEFSDMAQEKGNG